VINRVPTGWLGFLGVKNFGRNPREHGEVLQPVWDLRDIYLNANVRYATLAFDPAMVIQSYTLFTCPLDEVWYVSQFSFYFNTQAASSVTLELIQLSQSGASCGISNSASLIASQIGSLALDRELWLSPGEALGVRVLALTGAVGFKPSLRYSVLQA
jgi:hypothetical protein